MTSPRVFVVNEPLTRNGDGEQVSKLDLEPALRFGALIHLLPAGPVRAMGELANPLRAIDRLWDGLDDYNHQDYLLLAGDMAYVSLAVAIAAQLGDGRVSLLRWDNSTRDYVPMRVRLWEPLDQRLTEEKVT